MDTQNSLATECPISQLILHWFCVRLMELVKRVLTNQKSAQLQMPFPTDQKLTEIG